MVLFPGNPGIAGYYERWAEQVAERLGARVTVVSHAGHAEHTRSSWRVFPLCEQQAHKFSALELLADEPDVPLTVVGHSIGAHMALDCLSPPPGAPASWRRRLRGIVCLTPFLQTNAKSRTQTTLNKLVRVWPLHLFAALLGEILRLLPAGIRAFIFTRVLNYNMAPHASAITQDSMLRSGMLLNYLGMGHSEFDDLGKIDAAKQWEPVIEKHADVDVSFTFATEDHWGPEWKRDALQAAIPRARFQTFAKDAKSGIQHDFPTTEPGSAFFAEHVVEAVRTMGTVAHPIK